ncbi:hypothetical protein U4E84_04290 [Halorubrum sp. AD140]|uniref:hypothetical protein n=1 Tax=Halorubrum sp. AD140 TaxID=3050073 RepID=UPI002ACC808C|nr:hypothetical protein [Halorubrum sp. AD140]MDZ5810568.1 hypothetical protein [Halorubrum sp. AD140]
MTQLEITDVVEPEVNSEENDSESFIALTRAATLSLQESHLREVLAAADTVADAGVGATERSKIVRRVVDNEADQNPARVGPGWVSWSCAQDGSNADGAIQVALRDDIPHLFVYNFSVFGQSPGVISDRIREATDAGITVHIVSRGFDVNDENVGTVLTVLYGLDETGLELQREAEMRDVQAWTGGFSQDRGRASLGFTYDDGEVVPGENFDEVRAVLAMVLDDSPDGLSRRQAAERLDASPRTISRAIEERPDRYGLTKEDTGE